MSEEQKLTPIERASESDRREVLKYLLSCMAVAGANPLSAAAFLAQDHSAHRSSSKSARKYRPLITGRPTFFTENEYRTLARMVDLIIPRTSTPGAADAGVPLYIDIVAGSDASLGQRFKDGLAQLDGISMKATRKKFVSAGRRAQVRILESMLPPNASENPFFETVKAMTIVGYYSSEIGLYEELHFIGNEALSSFSGCTHGGHRLPSDRQPRRASNTDNVRLWPFPTSDNILGEDL